MDLDDAVALGAFHALREALRDIAAADADVSPERAVELMVKAGIALSDCAAITSIMVAHVAAMRTGEALAEAPAEGQA